MIYYTNVELTKPHMAFIGRWSPLHKGHLALIEKKRSQNPKLPILILVRETKYDDYSASLRSELIKMWMKYHKIKGTIIIVPDIEGVYWGRQVGYKTEKVDVNEKSKLISGTTIRNGIKKREKTWQKIVVNKKHSYLLTPTVAKIAEKGLVVWLTGCPNAGKTTISNNLAKKIKFSYPHLKIQILDGDVIRNSALAQGIGFSLKDRNLHIKRMGQLAKILADLGTLVICSFVSPLRKMRAEAKKTLVKIDLLRYM